MSKKYYYETHMHTVEASACAGCPGRNYIPFFKSIGYDGIIITDHFFNGNCAVDSSLPWKDRVERFCIGYEHAKEIGDRENFSVFFGFEVHFHCDEYLIYGLDKQWLLTHPEIMEWSRGELYTHVQKDGGLMIQAHPFRERELLTREIHLMPYCVDGVEICNAGLPDEQNILAYYYARHFNLPITSGSDIHFDKLPQRGLKGIITDHPLTTIQDYIEMIKSGTGWQTITSMEAVDWNRHKLPGIPVTVHDKSGAPTDDSYLPFFQEIENSPEAVDPLMDSRLCFSNPKVSNQN